MKTSIGFVCIFLCLVGVWAEKVPAESAKQNDSPEPSDIRIEPFDQSASDGDVGDNRENDEDGIGRKADDAGSDVDDNNDKDIENPGYQVLSEESSTPAPALPVPATIAPNLPDFFARKEGAVCLRAAFQAAVTVKYTTINPETNVLQARFTVPKDAAFTGKCENSESTLDITWGDNQMSFTFSEEKSSKTKVGKDKTSVFVWAVTSLRLTFNTNDTTNFPDALSPGVRKVSTAEKERHFEAPSNFSYSCSTQEDIALFEYLNGTKSTKSIASATLSIWDVKIEAFHIASNGDFSHAAKCAPDVEKELPRHNIAPVAVAASLAGIILLMIVAYFFIKNRYKSPYKGLD